MRRQRWELIPPERRAEFSFGTRLFPSQEPADPDSTGQAAWEEVPPGLRGAFGSLDRRYPRGVPPEVELSAETQLSGWRGERVATQLVLWSSSEVRQVRWRIGEFTSEDGATLRSDCLRVHFLRYVLSDDGSQGGRGEPPTKKFLTADVLDEVERFDLAERNVRPLWLTVDIPAEAAPGRYRAELTVVAAGGVELPFRLELEVQPRLLPSPAEWAFNLELWQNPWAVARYHGVRPWSPEHWALLRPVLGLLAEAGGKCITATIIPRPWGGQTYDAYESMVQWIRQADGAWRYDYALFDRWVEFCDSVGFHGPIYCYSVLSWSGYTFLDEATGELVTLDFKTGSPEYAALWKPFLKDFTAHLREKGWYDRAVFAIDEAPLETMQQFIGFLRADAPGLKIALAGGWHPEIREEIHSWCCFIDQEMPREVIEQRRAQARPTTYYVCCGPERPNTFAFSPPAESVWLGWYAFARGFDGFLRWAYNSWPLEPLVDSRYIAWPAGDCFLVYPGPRSSVRFERLREGIQDYEKLRLLRQELLPSSSPEAREKLDRLDRFLAGLRYDPAAGTEVYLEQVRAGKRLLEELSR